MPRIVKDYDERYTEFLDTAQMLFFTRGYVLTSVQDIINAVGVAKGTFYHYFDSKTDILDAVIKRMYQQTIISLQPIVKDNRLNATEKLKKLFNDMQQWEINNKPFILDVLRVFYAEENALLREKIFTEARIKIAPLVAQLIQQGIEEDIFEVDFPLETAEMLCFMAMALEDGLVSLILAPSPQLEEIERVKRQIHVFNLSVTRVLGIKTGIFILCDVDVLDAWV